MTWLLAELGRPGRPRGVLDGGDVEPTTGRLLSVAELQRVLRATAPAGLRCGAAPVATGRSAPSAPSEPATAWSAGPAVGPGPRPDPTSVGGWIAVLGAHPGAGTSTVALAVADAAATDGRGVHLVSCSPPARCGLAAVTSTELGVDAGGRWRSGRRGPRITVHRLTGSGVGPAHWPTPGGGAVVLTVVDLEAGAEQHVRSLAGASAVLVVCRVSVPGVRHAERLLAELSPAAGRPVLVAAVGPSSWPGVVMGSSGPLLRGLRAAGRVVPVPVDRRLDSTGPSGAALPRQVSAAGGAVLRQLSAGLPVLAEPEPRRSRRPRRTPTAFLPARPAPDRPGPKDN